MAPVWIKLVSECRERQDDASSEGGAAVIFRFDAPAPASGVCDGDGRAVRSALLREALASLPGYRHDAGGAGYALKLRNSRGSLVPVVVGRSLPSNSAKSPHTLELVRLGGRAAEASSSPQASSSQDVVAEALRRKLSAIGSRLSALEECCDRDGAGRPGMKSRHDEEELFHLKQRTDFLLLRSQASESADWEGMFRRNPMW